MISAFSPRPLPCLLAALGSWCAGCHAPPDQPVAAAPAAQTAAPPPATPRPVAYDTVAARTIYVNDQQLWADRHEVRRALGPADSVAAAYDGPALALPPTLPDSVLLVERYGGVRYGRVGSQLFVLDTPPRRPFRVQIGPYQFSERTTAAELRAAFPDSYRNRVAQADGRSQLLLLFPQLPDTTRSFLLGLHDGRLAYFRQSFDALDYD